MQRDRAPKDTQKRGRAPSLPCSLNLIRDAKSEPKALEAHGRRAIQKSSTVHLGWHNAIHSTMAIHTPSLFTDSDVLTFRETPVSDYRIPYTFVESLNEGTLFDRSARTFEEAARTQRLYDVIVANISGSSAPGCCRTHSRKQTVIIGKRSWALSWCIPPPAA